MAQTGFTPIQLYRSVTAATAPLAADLAAGELALNTTDEKLYFKNTGGTAKILANAAIAGIIPGTGVATALAVNVGSAGAPVVNGGALGTPSSGTLTNATGLPAAGVTGTAVTQTTLNNGTLPANVTTLEASGSAFIGGIAAPHQVEISGNGTGTGGGAGIIIRNAGGANTSLGNYSFLTGTAYSDVSRLSAENGLTIGKFSGLTTWLAIDGTTGAITTNNNTLNTGSGSVTTTGTLRAGGVLVTATVTPGAGQAGIGVSADYLQIIGGSVGTSINNHANGASLLSIGDGGGVTIPGTLTVTKAIYEGSIAVPAAATYTVAENHRDVICTYASGTVTLTLPTITTSGKRITIKTLYAFTVVSASSNVFPLAGGAAGTAILAATVGKWAELISDGTGNWYIMAGN